MFWLIWWMDILNLLKYSFFWCFWYLGWSSKPGLIRTDMKDFLPLYLTCKFFFSGICSKFFSRWQFVAIFFLLSSVLVFDNSEKNHLQISVISYILFFLVLLCIFASIYNIIRIKRLEKKPPNTSHQIALSNSTTIKNYLLF